MNTRILLKLLILLSLVFNQVAASIHVVKHFTPTAVVAANPSTHQHDTLRALIEHQEKHHQHLTDDQDHADSATITCLSYHVLLATPCALTSDTPATAMLPGTHLPVTALADACPITTTSTISIRGPPVTSCT